MIDNDRNSKNSSYVDKAAFDAVVANLDEELEASRVDIPTDGWDAQPRSSEVVDTPENTLPLGHIALLGDFPDHSNE